MPALSVWFDGEMILSHNSEHHAFHHEKAMNLEAGKKYKVVYEYRNWYGDGDSRLLWAMPNMDMCQQAMDAARRADVVVLVLGLSQRFEGFKRIMLRPNESKVVEFNLDPRQLSIINNKDQRVIEPGWFTVAVGGKQPGFTGIADALTTDVVTGREFPFAIK